MTVLLSSYRREKWRMSKSQITGSGRKRYVSKWFAFDDFSFMQDKLTTNDTTGTMQEPTSNNEGESSQETSQKKLMEKMLESVLLTQAKKFQKNLPRTQRKRKHDEEENEMLTEAFKILTGTSQATDPYLSYGQYIGNELRKYDKHTLIYVKQAINNIIFEADLGKYSPKCETQHGTPNSSTRNLIDDS
ncbi:unnamed protein product [Parnassius apollo]|uniref:(apollo) hypothetical protein n=1 Tax=Parnassius apollo TaxID=110799 RepID=A0A8S3WYT2_PARAO|nr:unnamed protein product [Parnassius apollo]